MEQITNCNIDGLVCVILKMISGEEIITHVDPKMYGNHSEQSLVLYDPFVVKMDKGIISMAVWVISNMDHEHVIDKSDIMIRSYPDNRFEEAYIKMVLEKWNQEIEDNSNMENLEDKVISTGTDTIN